MGGRYPYGQGGPGDRNYPPPPLRDRSPPRFDRRSSIPNRPHSSNRGDSSLSDNPTGTSNSSREPPRGPKALVDSTRPAPSNVSNFAPGGPRGRGFTRGGDRRDWDRGRDFRDRDFRDRPGSRPELDRERGNWRDDRDGPQHRRPSPLRRRSPTPPSRDLRDARDHPRDIDVMRGRRSSRDEPLSAGSSSSGPSASGGLPFGRGGFARGRGRGDFDPRGRGRGVYGNDEEGGVGYARSRSRERRRERDDRDFDRRDDRRDEHRRLEREEREREAERYKRERMGVGAAGTGSVDTRLASNPHTASGPSSSVTSPHALSADGRGFSSNDAASRHDGPGQRAPSGHLTSTHKEASRGDLDANSKDDPATSRAEATRERYGGGSRTASPPPQAPQVPAFGSLTYSHKPAAAVTTGPSSNTWRAKPLAPPVELERSGPQNNVTSVDGAKLPPSGPRSTSINIHQAPTGPRAERLGADGADANKFADHKEIDRAQSLYHQQHQQSSTNPFSAPASQDDNPFSGPRAFSQGPESSVTSPVRMRPAALAHQPSNSRPTSSSSASAFGRGPPLPPQGSPTAQINRSPSAPVSARLTSADQLARQASFGAAPSLGANIPTGPRADRAGRGRAKQWIRGGLPYGPHRGTHSQGPSPVRNDRGGRAVSVGRTAPWEENLSFAGSPVKPSAAARTQGEIKKEDTSLSGHETTITAAPALISAADEDAHMADIKRTPSPQLLTLGLSDEDEDEDDDIIHMDMDDTLQMQQSAAEQRIEELQGKSILLGENPIAEFEYLRDLESVLENTDVNAVLEVPAPPQTEAAALPTPEDDNALEPLKTQDSVPYQAQHLRPTPPVESLPFLATGPPTPMSFVETEEYQQNLERHQHLRSALTDVIRDQKAKVFAKHDEGRREYARLYKPWRVYANSLDERARQGLAAAKASEDVAVPAEVAPPAPPVVVPEGRAAYRMNTSELTFQRILKETEELAKAEALEEDLRAKAKNHVHKEAVCPDMLDEVEKRSAIYKDNNQFIELHQTLQAFNFCPPPVNFSPEEMKLFTDAFVANPKKWGLIAESLPNRDFHECIEHYYQTKDVEKYKLKVNRRNKRKGRGRTGPVSSRGAASSQLMTNLGVRPDDGDDVDATPTPVTDTGRPRRDAAPVFGKQNNNNNNTQSESSTPSQISGGRRGATTPRNDPNADNATDKGAKRGRGTTTTREKGAKRAKNAAAQPLAAASNAAGASAPPDLPDNSSTETAKGKDKDAAEKPPKREANDEGKPTQVNDSQLLGVGMAAGRGGAGTIESASSLKAPDGDRPSAISRSRSPSREQSRQPRTANRGGAVVERNGTAATAPGGANGGSGGNPTSSYWSVPESTDFPKLLDHFGSDWQAIASHMTSKTSVMVRNFFNREVGNGRTEWKERADAADAKRIRGEPMGQPPAPSVLPKRRYDPPSTSTQQPLAPRVAGGEVREGSPLVQAPPMSSAPTISPPQSVPPSRYAPLAQAGQSAPPPPARNARAAGPPPPSRPAATTSQAPVDKSKVPPGMQGPRAGYFPADTRADRPILQAQQPARAQPPPGLEQPAHLTQRGGDRLSTQRPPYQSQMDARHAAPPSQAAVPHAVMHPSYQSGGPSSHAVPASAQGRTITSAVPAKNDARSQLHAQQLGHQQQPLQPQPPSRSQGPPPPSSAPIHAASRHTEWGSSQPPSYREDRPMATASSPSARHARPNIMPAHGAVPPTSHTPQSASYATSASAPPPPSARAPPRPVETASKRSNIMDLLNPDKADDRAAKRPRTAGGSTITSSSSSPTAGYQPGPAPMHQPPPPSTGPRRGAEPSSMMDHRHPPPPQHHQYGQRSTSGGEMYTMPGQAQAHAQAQAPPPPPSGRDPRSLHESAASSTTISPGGSGGWYARPYASSTAPSSSQASPQPQHAAPPPPTYSSRSYQQPMHTNSPPPGPASQPHQQHGHGSHSRGPSYSTDRSGSGLLGQQPGQVGHMRHSSPLAQGGGYAPPPPLPPSAAARHPQQSHTSRGPAEHSYGQPPPPQQQQPGRPYTPGGGYGPHQGSPYDPPPPSSSSGGGGSRGYERR